MPGKFPSANIVNFGLKSIWYHRGRHVVKPVPTTEKIVERTWHLFDARNQTLGKMAVRIGKLLQGKHKPTYTPRDDIGDIVVVTNAYHVFLSDNPRKGKFKTKDRWKTKVYRTHSGRPGGEKFVRAYDWRERRPEHIIEHAVQGLLPKNKFRRSRMTRLLVYPGPEHPWTQIFPDYAAMNWRDLDPRKVDFDKVAPLEVEDDWLYDVANMKRYREIDGVVYEEDLPQWVEGYEGPPDHDRPYHTYWDLNEFERLKPISETLMEQKLAEITAQREAERAVATGYDDYNL